MSVRHDNLVTIIGVDLLRNNKLAICLLLLIVASALSTIGITFNTRLMIDKREQLILEQDKLNVEWRNLILEEEVLGKQNRIFQIATKKLNMHPVEMDEESIVIEKQ